MTDATLESLAARYHALGGAVYLIRHECGQILSARIVGLPGVKDRAMSPAKAVEILSNALGEGY